MEMKDWLILGEIQNLKNAQSNALQKLEQDTLSEIRHARSMAQSRMHAQSMHFYDKIAQLHENYATQLKNNRQQIMNLVEIVNEKNKIINSLKKQIIQLGGSLDDFENTQTFSNEQWVEVLENYLYLESFIEKSQKDGLSENDEIGGRKLKDWIQEYKEIQLALPSGDKLEEIIDLMTQKNSK